MWRVAQTSRVRSGGAAGTPPKDARPPCETDGSRKGACGGELVTVRQRHRGTTTSSSVSSRSFPRRLLPGLRQISRLAVRTRASNGSRNIEPPQQKGQPIGFDCVVPRGRESRREPGKLSGSLSSRQSTRRDCQCRPKRRGIAVLRAPALSAALPQPVDSMGRQEVVARAGRRADSRGALGAERARQSAAAWSGRGGGGKRRARIQGRHADPREPLKLVVACPTQKESVSIPILAA